MPTGVQKYCVGWRFCGHLSEEYTAPADAGVVREQREDGVVDAPITLESLEQPSRYEPIAKMLASEKGYNYSPSQRSDIDLCQIIDMEYVRSYGQASVYQLTIEQRRRIAGDLARRLHAPAAQILRCLALADHPAGF